MNRNTELHFSQTPKISINRSKFEMSHSHKTTFNTGDIIPVFVDADILPGDTVQMDMAELIRMATPIYPIMDNLYADVYAYFVPHRLVWDHWAEFWGQNDDPWVQQTAYEIPQIKSPQGGWQEGTIADYMGIPTKVSNLSVNALPFRAYCKVWNDWFRDENLKKCCHIYTDETTRTGTNSGDYVLNTELGAKPAKAAKLSDYFTRALPDMQKGPAVQIPLGTAAPLTGTASTTINGQGNKNVITTENPTVTNTNPLLFNKQTGMNDNIPYTLHAISQNGNNYAKGRIANISQQMTNEIGNLVPNNLQAQITGLTATTTINNMMVDLSAATAATVNQLRTAFAIQKYYENAALHGTRYIEYIKGVFGVTSSDARMQRAEFLGGQRFPINISQIVQTSSTDQTSPQGNAAGFSCTLNRDHMFTKSFEEHGTLMILMVVRTEHTYQQGLKKMWTRKRWEHFYNPFFAHLGETAVMLREIYAQGTDSDETAFGYQECWADYRYKQSFVSGFFRSNASGSLDAWHFADDYDTPPVLGSEWIDEPYQNVDRTIAVTSQLTHQFIADIFFKCYYTRPMPVYSVPGLIDHV